MSTATQLNAVLRATDGKGGGKGNARSTRREGHVPAVIYGNKETPLLISIDKNKLTPYTLKAGFMTHLVELTIDGKKHNVLPRDVQFDPVTDQPLHVDFLRVTDKTQIRVNVPIAIKNTDKSPGLKKGGVLNIVTHEIALYVLAGNIPEAIEVDASSLEIADSVHLSNVELPKGSRLINKVEASTTLATIAPPPVKVEVPAETVDPKAKGKKK